MSANGSLLYTVVSTLSGLVFVIASRLIDRWLPSPGHRAVDDAHNAPPPPMPPPDT